LAEQSRNTVTQAIQATRSSRVLVEQLTVMERSARQYFVLHDPTLLDNLSKAHQRFDGAMRQLAFLPLTQQQMRMLESLAADEASLHDDILSHSTEASPPQGLISRFVGLSEQAQAILSENNRFIDRESAVLSQAAERTQKMLLWQSLTLLPVAFLVALVITFLVAQPIRRMDAAIRRLGEGHYAEPISIDGPGDLRTLGDRLDWLREQLFELDMEKQRFLRHVSHELKTPLTAIREGSELLSDEIGGPLTSQQREIAGILRESSLRLQKMIENLLHYTAVQYKKPQLRMDKVELGALMDEVLENYALTLKSKQINIEREFQATPMRADQEKLKTVMDNLISNAVKYTPGNGNIRISVEPEGQFGVIEVHDGGPGVMAADRAKLFDPFYRGDGMYDSLVSGSGLGLSIAKEYVEAHGGEILLLPSEQGAHFRVRLPLDPASALVAES
ncbi:MAG TPA: ATP-binding protein, partial [Methylophilaceae bacterium]|nr:ATP-binding protein [Methylophilaceae bacterium]